MSGSGSGVAALIGAAAPGAAEGISNGIGAYQQQHQANAALPGTQQMIQNDPTMQALQNGTGQFAMPAPTFQDPATMGPQAIPMQGMQNGGVVRQNFGKAEMSPEFQRGPAIPTGPNSGIVPASTEGQILTFDAGGVVPDGYIQQPGITGVPMSGRGAALVEGLQAGQNLGRNFRQAWNTNRARSDEGNAAADAVSPDVNNPNPDPNHPDSMLGRAKSAVEGFFHHLHEGTLDDNHQPNQPAPGSPNYVPPPAGLPAGAAAPGGGAVPPTGAPGATPDAGGATAGGPPPAANTPAGPALPAGPAPAGAAPVPAPVPAAGAPNGGAPAPGQPSPPSQTPVSPVQATASQSALKDVVTDPNVKAGVPSASPAESGKAHSLSPDYWAHSNMLMQKAVRSAALAGEDPGKVYESLSAMRTAHFQGQVVKQAAAANVAYQNGDMDDVAKALKNINYYLPNGQDIDVRKATADDVKANPGIAVGDLVHTNPYQGMQGHQNDPALVKVDQQYIQALGTGALDPAKFNQAQMSTYTAQQEAINNHRKTTAELLTAQGAADKGAGVLRSGTASLSNANLKVANNDAERGLTQSHIDLNEANAGKANRWVPADRGGSGQPKVTAASIRARQNDMSNYVDSAIQGAKEVQTPAIDPTTGKPNLTVPHAGELTHNPSKVPSSLVGLNPDGIAAVKQYGGNIAAANPEIPKEEAADLAARVVRQQQAPTTHMEKDGKRHVDYVVGKDKNGRPDGTAHVWMGNGYRSFYTAPNMADEGALPTGGSDSGNDQPVGSAGGGGGGGGDAASNEAAND
jgi:hypothetical protein